MRGFITDYWWVITGAILMILLAIHRYRTRPNFERPTNAKSFAAIRVFRPAELAPYFGTYVPQWTDLLGFVLFVFWFGVMVGIVVWELGGATTPIFVSSGAAVVIAALAVVVDTRSMRVISADRIAFESPLPSYLGRFRPTRLRSAILFQGNLMLAACSFEVGLVLAPTDK